MRYMILAHVAVTQCKELWA